MATEVDEALQPVNENDLPTAYFEVPEIEVHEDVEPTGPDEKSEFDQRWRDPFTGLLFLGNLKNTVTVYGHTFELETPTQNERLESGLIHKKYLNSVSANTAWQVVTVAIYLKKVDGQALPEPIGPEDTGVLDRFNWVVKNLRDPVINQLFQYCMDLDLQVAACLDELERLGEA